jgi:hypothetical protein
MYITVEMETETTYEPSDSKPANENTLTLSRYDYTHSTIDELLDVETVDGGKIKKHKGCE